MISMPVVLQFGIGKRTFRNSSKRMAAPANLPETMQEKKIQLSRKIQTIENMKLQVLMGKPIRITIASWNVNRANQERGGVMANVINSIDPDVIALQHVASPGRPTLDAIRTSLIGDWEYKICENRRVDGPNLSSSPRKDTFCMAFLWKKGMTNNIEECSYIQRNFFRSPCWKTFSMDNFVFKLVNFHLQPICENSHAKDMNRLHVALDVGENCCTILLGDFNEYPCNNELKIQQYKSVIPPDQKTNRNGTYCFCNLIVPYSFYQYCVSREVRRHPDIADGFINYPVSATFLVRKQSFFCLQEFLQNPTLYVLATAPYIGLFLSFLYTIFVP